MFGDPRKSGRFRGGDAGRDFDEHDVEEDGEAHARMIALTGQRTVPVLVEDGRVVQIGWQGRGCIVAAP